MDFSYFPDRPFAEGCRCHKKDAIKGHPISSVDDDIQTIDSLLFGRKIRFSKRDTGLPRGTGWKSKEEIGIG